MAQIDTGNQFMSLSALVGGKCKAFLTEDINTFRQAKKPLQPGGALITQRSDQPSSHFVVQPDTG